MSVNICFPPKKTIPSRITEQRITAMYMKLANDNRQLWQQIKPLLTIERQS